jgi:hypothetical protein
MPRDDDRAIVRTARPSPRAHIILPAREGSSVRTMLPASGGRKVMVMTITFATHTVTDDQSDGQVASEPMVLDGGLLFQPTRVVEHARQPAAVGVSLVVSMSLDVLDRAPLTGVSRKLIEAAAESRLRQALYAAGYRSVIRRPVADAIVLDASV